MGRFYGDNRKEMGFPDEFGEDICQSEQEQAPPGGEPEARASNAILRLCDLGVVRPLPALPPRRRERGWC